MVNSTIMTIDQMIALVKIVTLDPMSVGWYCKLDTSIMNMLCVKMDVPKFLVTSVVALMTLEKQCMIADLKLIAFY